MNLRLFPTLGVLALLVLAPTMRALTVYQFAFSQDFGAGAALTGSVTLTDTNEDGQVTIGGIPPDTVVGTMSLTGHPTFPSSPINLWLGWFNPLTLEFSLSGDNDLGPEGMIYGSIRNVGGTYESSFSGRLGTVASTQPITIMQRVPDTLPTALTTFVVFGLLAALRRAQLTVAERRGHAAP